MRIAGCRLVVSVLLLSLLAIAACTSQMTHSPQVKNELIERDFDSALRFVEKIDKSTSELLYLYEKGLVLHYDNEWAESNRALESAEDL